MYYNLMQKKGMQLKCSYRSWRDGMWANIASLTSLKVPLTMLLKGGGRKNEHKASEANKTLPSDESEKVERSCNISSCSDGAQYKNTARDKA